MSADPNLLDDVRRAVIDVPGVLDISSWKQDRPDHGNERYYLHFSHENDIRPPQMSVTLTVGKKVEVTMFASIGHVGKIGGFVFDPIRHTDGMHTLRMTLRSLADQALKERQTKRYAGTIDKYMREAHGYMRRLGPRGMQHHEDLQKREPAIGSKAQSTVYPAE